MRAEYLGSHGFRTAEAGDGAAMRVAIGQDLPDVVLLDLRLPREEGLSLARFLRERYDVGIIMVTAAGEIIDRVVGLEVGADDYVTKPFGPRELLARLKSVMRRSQARPAAASPGDAPAQPRTVPFGRCRLDLAAQQFIDADGAEIPTTSMEFDLLKVFVEHPGKALSRDRILTLTRNREWEPFDRSIDIRIARRAGTPAYTRPMDQPATTLHAVERALHEKRAIEFEESGDFGGGPRTYLSSRFALFDADGAVYAVCGIATDITERKHLEDALSSAALAVSTAEDESLYRELVRHLATILGVDGAFIATFDAADPCRLHMCAFYLDGRIVENFAYPMSGTPCEPVLGQQFRFHAERLPQLFPADTDFHKLGVESYAGYPLNDAAGRTRGLISAIARKPLERPAFVESVLRIFAVRASAEIDRARFRGAQGLRDELPRDLRGERRRDLRPRLGHRRDRQRQSARLRTLRLQPRGTPPLLAVRHQRVRAAIYQRGGDALDRAGEARRGGALRMAAPQQGRQPALGRGGAAQRAHRRPAARARLHA